MPIDIAKTVERKGLLQKAPALVSQLLLPWSRSEAACAALVCGQLLWSRASRPLTFRVTWPTGPVLAGTSCASRHVPVPFCSSCVTSAQVRSGAVVCGPCGRITGLECPSVCLVSRCSCGGRFWHPCEGPPAEFPWRRLCQPWSARVDLTQLGCFVFSLLSEPQAMCYVETANLDGETNLKIRQVTWPFTTCVLTEPRL